MYGFTPLQLFYSAFRCSVTWTPAGVGIGRVGVGVARLINKYYECLGLAANLRLQYFVKYPKWVCCSREPGHVQIPGNLDPIVPMVSIAAFANMQRIGEM
jgi:hypothetical protein